MSLGLGERLRRARKAVGLSQEEASARSGVSREMISYYETGARTPGLRALYRLATVYGVPLDDLAAEDGAGEDRSIWSRPRVPTQGSARSWGAGARCAPPRERRCYATWTT
jgi:transcriptional regulator with XRE-family HTH domain